MSRADSVGLSASVPVMMSIITTAGSTASFTRSSRVTNSVPRRGGEPFFWRIESGEGKTSPLSFSSEPEENLPLVEAAHDERDEEHRHRGDERVMPKLSGSQQRLDRTKPLPDAGADQTFRQRAEFHQVVDEIDR